MLDRKDKEKIIEKFRTHASDTGSPQVQIAIDRQKIARYGIAVADVDAAIETADIALMSDDLSKIPWLIGHAQFTLQVIRQNIFFALGVKAVFMALALMNMATLWMAIAADMGASLIVILNALRLLNANKIQ